MLGYWIETRYFAASIGDLTPEQYTLFYKLCQSKVQQQNGTHSEITLCDFTQKWDTHTKTENDFWKEVDKEHSDCQTFVRIFPEGAINIRLENFPPDFIKKRNRFNKIKGQCTSIFQEDTEKNDWNLIDDLLELADAARENYFGEQRTQYKQPPIVSKEVPATVSITNIDDLRIAVYEGVLMANNADDTDKWDILSKMKYRGKGWSAIARTMLELEQKNQEGEMKPITKDAINKKAREVQRDIESRRKYILGIDTIGEYQDD